MVSTPKLRIVARGNQFFALDLARRGVAVFPCRPNKKPYTKHGLNDATTDAAKIREWWSKKPDALIGIPTGSANDLFVVDLDVKNGVDGFASLDRLGLLDVVKTGVEGKTQSNGSHFYFRAGGLKLASTAGAIGAGVDTRGDGGYVVLWDTSINPLVAPEVPQQLVDYLNSPRFKQAAREARKAKAAFKTEVARVREAADGERNDTLNRAAFALYRHVANGHLSADQVRDKLTEAAAEAGLPDDEIEATLASAERAGTAAGAATTSLPLSDDALALRFADRHAGQWRYVATFGKWMQWDRHRWREEKTYAAYDLSRAICREVAERPGQASKQTVHAVADLARTDRRHAATDDQWDTDPWLLNTPGGVVDLRIGKTRPHDPLDYMTKTTAVAPGGDCPTWLRFLHRVTNSDQELIDYLQRFAGYCLTGVTTEQMLAFCYGTGANGKSTFINTLTGILGDYARTAPIETFTDNRFERHPTDLAMLRGARLVTAVETEQGRPWAESRLKALTGGEPIAARFMRQDFFEYVPQFKLLIAGNHKPTLRSVDDAIRRRLHLVPFDVRIPVRERDHDLADKLKVEWPGVLQWMVAGCICWQLIGLEVPRAVRRATNKYLETEDAFGQWFAERLVPKPGHSESFASLFASWSRWADKAGEEEGTGRAFAENLSKRLEKATRGHGKKVVYVGAKLRWEG